MLELYMASLISLCISSAATLPFVFEVLHVLVEAFFNVVGWPLVLDQYGVGCFFLEAIHLAAL